MTDLVSSTDIELIVGAPRHQTLHLGRAVSAECRVYILHSQQCLASTPDLRECTYSLTLDYGDDSPEEWPADQPLVLDIEVADDGARLIPAADQTPVPATQTAVARLEALAVGVALSRAALTYEDEVSLHAEICVALAKADLWHRHEVRFDAHDRIDLLTTRGVGIEVKVAGSVEAVMRQLLRYAEHKEVHALVLVTTIAAHLAIPREFGGKPVVVHSLIGQGL